MTSIILGIFLGDESSEVFQNIYAAGLTRVERTISANNGGFIQYWENPARPPATAAAAAVAGLSQIGSLAGIRMVASPLAASHFSSSSRPLPPPLTASHQAMGATISDFSGSHLTISSQARGAIFGADDIDSYSLVIGIFLSDPTKDHSELFSRAKTLINDIGSQFNAGQWWKNFKILISGHYEAGDRHFRWDSELFLLLEQRRKKSEILASEQETWDNFLDARSKVIPMTMYVTWITACLPSHNHWSDPQNPLTILLVGCSTGRTVSKPKPVFGDISSGLELMANSFIGNRLLSSQIIHIAGTITPTLMQDWRQLSVLGDKIFSEIGTPDLPYSLPDFLPLASPDSRTSMLRMVTVSGDKIIYTGRILPIEKTRKILRLFQRTGTAVSTVDQNLERLKIVIQDLQINIVKFIYLKGPVDLRDKAYLKLLQEKFILPINLRTMACFKMEKLAQAIDYLKDFFIQQAGLSTIATTAIVSLDDLIRHIFCVLAYFLIKSCYAEERVLETVSLLNSAIGRLSQQRPTLNQLPAFLSQSIQYPMRPESRCAEQMILLRATLGRLLPSPPASHSPVSGAGSVVAAGSPRPEQLLAAPRPLVAHPRPPLAPPHSAPPRPQPSANPAAAAAFPWPQPTAATAAATAFPWTQPAALHPAPPRPQPSAATAAAAAFPWPQPAPPRPPLAAPRPAAPPHPAAPPRPQVPVTRALPTWVPSVQTTQGTSGFVWSGAPAQTTAPNPWGYPFS